MKAVGRNTWLSNSAVGDPAVNPEGDASTCTAISVPSGTLGVCLQDAIISNMKTIAITIEADLLERVDRLAGKNRSKAIRQAVREYVVRLEQDAEDACEAAVVRRHRSRLARQARELVREQAKP